MQILRLPAVVLAFLTLGALGASLVAPASARANVAKSVVDGERHGLLVPTNATSVRVDRESLAFALASTLDHAAVSAVYHLTNTGDAPEHAALVFAFVRGDGEHVDPHAAIEVDGAPVSFRDVTDGALLAPRLGAFLGQHADIAEELRAPTDPGKLRALVEAAGGRCASECASLLAWQRSLVDADPAGRPEDRIVYDAAREAIPAAVDELSRQWSQLADPTRLGFLLFQVDFAPRAPRTIAVHYEHRATDDLGAHANDTFRFDYLLSPAKRWASFGPLDVTVQVPGNAQVTSNVALARDGDTYHADLATLPDGELSFEVTSLDGLWLGIMDPRGYWAIVVAAVALASAAVGGAAGRVWSGAGWRRFATPLVTAAPLAAACAFAVIALLLASFPPRALGFGYGGMLGCALLVLVSGPLGALASLASSAMAARRARGSRS
jgi:hypothetical protein